jgi:hypothetical protein
MIYRTQFASILIVLAAMSLVNVGSGATNAQVSAGAGTAGRTLDPDCAWMLRAKFGIFMHYQYRILLGRSIRTKPQFPEISEMTAAGWNAFVDGFDVNGFAKQMADAKVGWVIFCLDDHYYAWPCAPSEKFDQFTGYAPGEKCSRRDLIGELADALSARGVKLIVYTAMLNGYMKEPKVTTGLLDDGNNRTAPSAQSRARRLAILKEYADRYKDKIAGWWFDGLELNSYHDEPDDWSSIGQIVRAANPDAVIAFSCAKNEEGCMCKGVDNYAAGDTWSKQDLDRLTPEHLPPQDGVLWHGKIYCGNVYHGQGDANQFNDIKLVNWIKTCNRQRGICTLDWPIDPKTGLLKEFGFEQLKRVSDEVRTAK